MAATYPEEGVSAPPASNRGGRQATLLIVDDEAGPRESLKIVFRDDYHILLAKNGVEALQIIRQGAVDAIILDIRMKGMSGIEVLQGAKAIDRDVEVIMLTAYETLETARQALRLGACDYLDKPFEIGAVRAAVRTAMERRAVSMAMRGQNQRLLELQAEIQDRQLREEVARTRGEIYASIIHDINGPLTIISGFIDSINHRMEGVDRVDGDDLVLIKDRLARVTRQVNSCIALSRRYLGFLRGRGPENSPVSVNQALNDLLELLQAHPSAAPHELTVELLETDAAVQINGTDLIQILLNLSINGLQSDPSPHRVEVRARREPGPPPAAEVADGPHDKIINRGALHMAEALVSVQVADNGPGIHPGVIDKIFEPYFTTKSDNAGTGLGLSIVTRLTEEANAALHLNTRVGGGARFTLYLSADPRQPNRPPGRGLAQ